MLSKIKLIFTFIRLILKNRLDVFILMKIIDSYLKYLKSHLPYLDSDQKFNFDKAIHSIGLLDPNIPDKDNQRKLNSITEVIRRNGLTWR